MNSNRFYSAGEKKKTATTDFSFLQTLVNQRGSGSDYAGNVFIGGGVSSSPSYWKPSSASTFVEFAAPNNSTVWELVGGCPNGDLYFGGNNVLYKKVGGVGAWVPANRPTGFLIGFHCLPNGHIYIGVLNGSIHKSTDNGNTWTSVSGNAAWFRLTSLNNNIYACVDNGDIYMQTNATGPFVALGQTSRLWRGITSDGVDVYASVWNDKIYKQTGGVGNFVQLPSSPTAEHYSMTVDRLTNVMYPVVFTGVYKSTKTISNAPIILSGLNSDTFVLELNDGKQWTGFAGAKNGDVYASTYQGLYIQTGGVGAFTLLENIVNGQRIRIAPNGDVYLAVYGGDIYKQTNGSGAFVAQGAGNRNWYGLAITANGDVYACVLNGAIYKQTGGVGAFAVYNATIRAYVDMDAHRSGDVYVAVNNGQIYKLDGVGGLVVHDSTVRFYDGIAFCGDDLYTVESNIGVKVQRNRTGAFTAIPLVNTLVGIGTATNNNIYLASLGNGFYKSLAKSV